MSIETAKNGKKFIELTEDRAAQFVVGDFYTVQTHIAVYNPEGLRSRKLTKAAKAGELEQVGETLMGFVVSGKGDVYEREGERYQRIYGDEKIVRNHEERSDVSLVSSRALKG